MLRQCLKVFSLLALLLLGVQARAFDTNLRLQVLPIFVENSVGADLSFKVDEAFGVGPLLAFDMDDEFWMVGAEGIYAASGDVMANSWIFGAMGFVGLSSPSSYMQLNVFTGYQWFIWEGLNASIIAGFRFDNIEEDTGPSLVLLDPIASVTLGWAF